MKKKNILLKYLMLTGVVGSVAITGMATSCSNQEKLLCNITQDGEKCTRIETNKNKPEDPVKLSAYDLHGSSFDRSKVKFVLKEKVTGFSIQNNQLVWDVSNGWTGNIFVGARLNNYQTVWKQVPVSILGPNKVSLADFPSELSLFTNAVSIDDLYNLDSSNKINDDYLYSFHDVTTANGNPAEFRIQASDNITPNWGVDPFSINIPLDTLSPELHTLLTTMVSFKLTQDFEDMYSWKYQWKINASYSVVQFVHQLEACSEVKWSEGRIVSEYIPFTFTFNHSCFPTTVTFLNDNIPFDFSIALSSKSGSNSILVSRPYAHFSDADLTDSNSWASWKNSMTTKTVKLAEYGVVYNRSSITKVVNTSYCVINSGGIATLNGVLAAKCNDEDSSAGGPHPYFTITASDIQDASLLYTTQLQLGFSSYFQNKCQLLSYDQFKEYMRTIVQKLTIAENKTPNASMNSAGWTGTIPNMSDHSAEAIDWVGTLS